MIDHGFQIEWRCWCVGFDFTFFPDWGTLSFGPLQFWWRSARWSLPVLTPVERHALREATDIACGVLFKNGL